MATKQQPFLYDPYSGARAFGEAFVQSFLTGMEKTKQERDALLEFSIKSEMDKQAAARQTRSQMFLSAQARGEKPVKETGFLRKTVSEGVESPWKAETTPATGTDVLSAIAGGKGAPAVSFLAPQKVLVGHDVEGTAPPQFLGIPEGQEYAGQYTFDPKKSARELERLRQASKRALSKEQSLVYDKAHDNVLAEWLTAHKSALIPTGQGPKTEEELATFQNRVWEEYQRMLGEKTGTGPAKPKAFPEMLTVDKEAYDWARAHPSDPRTGAILRRLKTQYKF